MALAAHRRNPFSSLLCTNGVVLTLSRSLLLQVFCSTQHRLLSDALKAKNSELLLRSEFLPPSSHTVPGTAFIPTTSALDLSLQFSAGSVQNSLIGAPLQELPRARRIKAKLFRMTPGPAGPGPAIFSLPLHGPPVGPAACPVPACWELKASAGFPDAPAGSWSPHDVLWALPFVVRALGPVAFLHLSV